VGKATDLRARVRSYFSGDDRRKVGALLREAVGLDHEVCATALEASVREVRLIHELAPRFNTRTKGWRSCVYLKLTTNEAFPRLSVTRVARRDGGTYLGPLPSARVAALAAEAIMSVVPLRRCAARLRPGIHPRLAPCAPAQLGVASCPCAGTVDQDAYAGYVRRVVRALAGEPELVLVALAERLATLARAQRFEEATLTRRRATALVRALARQRSLDRWRRSGRVVLELPGGPVELVDGRLAGTTATASEGQDEPAPQLIPDPTLMEPLECRVADELAAVSGWVEGNAHRVRLLHADRGLSCALPPLPSFEPRAVGAPRRPPNSYCGPVA
jgi:DNA polymerase-3 subunit epsilon